MVTQRLVRGLELDTFDDDDLSRLGRAFRHDLVARGGPAALAEAVALVRVMQADRVRVLEQGLLEEVALRRQLHDTFRYSIDLMLLAAGAQARSSSIAGLVEAFAWCSTIRDLKEDLARGLVNIPAEVLAAARVRDLGDVDGIRRVPVIASWLNAEARRAEHHLDAADAAISALQERRARRLLAMFARSIRRYLDRFPARHGLVASQSSAISG